MADDTPTVEQARQQVVLCVGFMEEFKYQQMRVVLDALIAAVRAEKPTYDMPLPRQPLGDNDLKR